MELRIIETGTPDYDKMIDLRMHVLLNPIGIPRSYINPQKEREDVLVGAFDGEKIIGCCILTPLDQSTVQLRQMAVDNIFQKRGIGAAIVAFSEEFSRNRGFQKLVMHARDSVIDFYKKCGYSISGQQFFEVGIAHHKMEKALV